jgi:glycosyltransferase involved in cell wall biosynthesis
VVPNPVPLSASEVCPTSFRKLYPELKDKLVFLFLSRIDQKKGLDLLLSAFAQAHMQVPETALVIAGDGSSTLITELKSHAARLGISDAVLWTGFLSGQRKREAFAMANVFVLVSYSENFCVAAVEAMASGLPIILSNRVALHDRISQTGAGLVVPCSTEAVADAMVAMARSRKLRLECALNGRELALHDYSPGAVVDKLEALYGRIVAEKHIAAKRRNAA